MSAKGASLFCAYLPSISVANCGSCVSSAHRGLKSFLLSMGVCVVILSPTLILKDYSLTLASALPLPLELLMSTSQLSLIKKKICPLALWHRPELAHSVEGNQTVKSTTATATATATAPATTCNVLSKPIKGLTGSDAILPHNAQSCTRSPARLRGQTRQHKTATQTHI